MHKTVNHSPLPWERQSVADNKIVLVGMMGSGKSTLGALLALRLGCSFVDVDAEIERDAGRRVADIFRDEGETEFRRREYETTKRLVEASGALVLAAGGGAFCQERIRELLQGRARSVFLRVMEEDLLDRLARSDVNDRPMLGGDAWRERVAELLRARYPIYGQADLLLDVGGDEAAEATAARLHSLIAGTAREAAGPRGGDTDAEN